MKNPSEKIKHSHWKTSVSLPYPYSHTDDSIPPNNRQPTQSLPEKETTPAKKKRIFSEDEFNGA